MNINGQFLTAAQILHLALSTIIRHPCPRKNRHKRRFQSWISRSIPESNQ